MSIEYKTEAKVVIFDKERPNSIGATKPVSLMWMVGDEKVKLVTSSRVTPDEARTSVVELSASQLHQIAELAPQIIRDLGDQNRHPRAA